MTCVHVTNNVFLVTCYLTKHWVINYYNVFYFKMKYIICTKVDSIDIVSIKRKVGR